MRYSIAAFAAVMLVGGNFPAMADETWSSFVKTAPALALPLQGTDVLPVIRGSATYNVSATTALGGSSLADITQYGAKCDGATDDSAALVAADALTGIGTLAVLATCRLSNNVTLAHSLYIGPQGALSVDTGKTLIIKGAQTDASSPFPGLGTVAAPGASSFTGVKDGLRYEVGKYPATGEFGGDLAATVGAVQGIVGTVVQPSNGASQPSSFFGVAGYSACSTSLGLAGSCTGVLGAGIALGPGTALAPSLVIGLDGVATNAPQVSNTATRTGSNYANVSGAEIDVNLMKLGDGSAPKANAVGISIVGSSETQPSSGATDCNGSPCVAAGIFIQPMGVSTALGWLDAIRITDAAATRDGLSLGAVCQATAQCSAQPIVLDAYSAAGVGNLVHGTIGLTGAGFFSMLAPAGGQVALQVGVSTILAATPTGILANQPITAASLIGGTATNTAMKVQSTTNGAPSGDLLSLQASTTFIGSTDGLTSYMSVSSSMVDFAVPIRFQGSGVGAVTPAFTNAPTGCTNVVWVGPFKTTSPAQSNVYLAACHT